MLEILVLMFMPLAGGSLMKLPCVALLYACKPLALCSYFIDTAAQGRMLHKIHNVPERTGRIAA